MSTICPRFAQNAWKKDLCSNCFKSKEEHKSQTTEPKHYKSPVIKNMAPPKGIMKSRTKKARKANVTFPKQMIEVIGIGGEWSECSSADEQNDYSEDEQMPMIHNTSISITDDAVTREIDELEQELQKLTKVNTDFNMNNGNLLGDPETNIRKSFALQLGTPIKDPAGQKQTLKISVTPFGAGQVTTNKVNDIRQKFSSNDEPRAPVVLKTIIKSTGVEYVEEAAKPLPKIEISEVKLQAPEKTLLEEISETLEKNKENKITFKELTENKLKVEAKKTTGSMDTKRSISRNAPIVKDSTKPKINVFPKFSDSDSTQSDTENGSTSGYYDVVEAANSYENIADGYERAKELGSSPGTELRGKDNSSFFSNHLISEMFSASKDRKKSRSYNFMSKITNDGLIVTKASSEDGLDSTGSSFDYASSSDEEMSSMNRSESDSGIGISVSNDHAKSNGKDVKDSSSSDYEDVQVDNAPKVNEKLFSADKSRELAGEPDGSADPDGSAEAPALPKSAPPSEPRVSFLHTKQPPNVEKPSVPAKPTVSIIKALVKRPQNSPEQQVINQLQQIMKPSSVNIVHEELKSETHETKESADMSKYLKKSRAPDPPSPSAEDLKTAVTMKEIKSELSNMVFHEIKLEPVHSDARSDDAKLMSQKAKADDQYSFLYTRNPTGSIGKSSSPVIREKDKRERATVNPKFRSLNTFSTQYKNQVREQRPTTPEPAPRKSLSLSQDCLLDDKKKKNKFSIKKFLRMGTNKAEPIYDKKDFGVYGKVTVHDKDSASSTLPQVKPRLVIIHPIDINKNEVEVIKDIASGGGNTSPEAGKIHEIVTGKPPAPPLRKSLDASKPNRPPPPKSAEVRKKQINLESPELAKHSGIKSIPNDFNGNDNLYANLGEVRSTITPRKPERTASMREREAQLELTRKRLSKLDHESVDSASVHTLELSSAHSTLDRPEKKPAPIVPAIEINKVSTRLEQFEKTISEQKQNSKSLLSDGIKSSMLKMNTTIDNYLKDRLAENSSTKSLISVSSPTIATPSTTPMSHYENAVLKSITAVNGTSNTVLNAATPTATSAAAATAASTEVAVTTPAVAAAAAPNDDKDSAPHVNRNSDVEMRTNYEPIVVQAQRSSLPDNSNTARFGELAGIAATRATTNGYSKSEYGSGLRLQSYNCANISRSVSRSYCGSEISESDYYSPYSFYGGSEAGTDVAGNDFADTWGGASHGKQPNRTMNRLRMRKGRSVVHKNLEDNYGAVVVANHEALAQVLEQLQRTTAISPLLLPLANSINLRFEDFTVLEGVRGVVAGRRAFHPAIWANQIHVTVALSVDCNQLAELNPITEFCDLVPSNYLPLMPSTENRMVQATISVLPRMIVDSLQTFGQMLKIRSENLKNQTLGGSTLNLASDNHPPTPATLRNGQSVQNLSTFDPSENEMNGLSQQMPGMPSFDDILFREVGFVMLQLVNGLKNIQAKGIEELPLSMSNVILCKELENKESQARLHVLHGLNQDLSRDEEEPTGTLCQCARAALTAMLPATKLTATLNNILVKDRSESLSKVKAVLEYALWGPSDVPLGHSSRERELALQRWLDLERATILHGLVRSRVELSVYDECHLIFLIRTSSKIMSEAASILSGFVDITE